MRCVFLVSLVFGLLGCPAPEPCPAYSGFPTEGRSWRFAGGDAEETRTLAPFAEDQVVLEVTFDDAGTGFHAEQSLSMRCDDDGVHLLEETLRFGVAPDLDEEHRVYSTPRLLLPADPRVGERFGGEFAYVLDDGTEVDGTSLVEIQDAPVLDTPLGELEVLAFAVVEDDRVREDLAALRHADFGLVGFTIEDSLRLVDLGR